MDKELEFNFDMLSKRQLLKLCNYYSLKINGALPNNFTSDEELLNLVKDNLIIEEDGMIVKKDEENNKKQPNEIKLYGGSKIRMIII